ncbi:MAG TPA: MlaD family protein [Solirubrobacteraceae bacterium]|nr:MlaD family protein [Solirubrobacteraceae bacterium]
MKRAIRVHRTDFLAIIALVVLALAVVIYILEHQPAFGFGKSYYTVKAQFATGAAVTAGQGQSVDVAGVQVGQVGNVTLQGGRAIVTMNIYKKYEPIYNDATVLLRPRTPLKDMYLSLDPGTKDAGAVPNNGTLPVANTQPDINVEEILSTLDVDTRNYLLLLLAGGAQTFHDGHASGPAPSPAAVADLTGTFKRFAPLNRDTVTFTTLLKERTVNIRRSIHNLQEVTQALGAVDGRLTSLINSSNTNFQAISSQDANLEQALTLLPGTLQATTQTLGKVQAFANASTPALRGLVPFAHAFGPALAAATPLFRDTTPVIKNQLRPFAVAIQPLAKILAPASAKLAAATPALTRSVSVLNTLFDELAYQPKGSEQGYLFWGSWLSHNALSLTNLQDAHGPVVRGLFMGTCSQLNLFEVGLATSDPALKPLLGLLNAPDWSKIGGPFCPTPIP